MQAGFYFDQTACTRCCTCIVACKDWHDLPAGPASFIRIKSTEKGKFPDVSVHHMFLSCFHCVEPACIPACPANAIRKREDGIVVVDRDACLGKEKCQMCLEVCPYEAPQFGAEKKATMQKCDLCAERLAEKKKPICVDACPMYALDAGPIEELRAKHGDVREAEGFTYSPKLKPSIVMRPRKDTKGRSIQKVVVTPPRNVT
ncbi:MAG: 4Fe-4S dicluster domain-containing protein [Dehalococcoidia bacterium]|nr:4Fe-4S dicluster domain-containing protein [Dehalococcoidia bacterium]